MNGSALNLVGAALRYGLEHTAVACWIESGGVIRYATQALAALLGAGNPTEIVGKRSAEFLQRRLGASETQPETVIAGLEPEHGENAVLRGRNERIFVTVTRRVVTFESELMVLCSFRDISKQRRALAELRALTQRFRRLYESDLIGIIDINNERILASNDYFLKLVGRTREELNRGELNWRKMTPPEFAGNDEKFLSQLLRGECLGVEKEFLHSSGARVPVILRCAETVLATQRRATCFVLDVTDRKKIEGFASERGRFETVGVLAAGVAHSLNNLLTTIIGNAGLLLEQQSVAEGAGSRDLVNGIISTGEQLATLASKLLAYAGQGRFVVSSADMNALIRRHFERIQARLPQNILVDLRLDPKLPEVSGDAKQLTYLIEALIENSIEAIGARPDGQIVVETRLEKVSAGALTVRLGEPLPAGDYCLIRIRDNGAGMDAKTLAHAFDPFFSTKFHGRGLGLAAVGGIVRAAHGAIRVMTEPAKGCDFQVYLPPGTRSSGASPDRVTTAEAVSAKPR